jgi:putative endonuclease
MRNFDVPFFTRPLVLRQAQDEGAAREQRKNYLWQCAPLPYPPNNWQDYTQYLLFTSGATMRDDPVEGAWVYIVRCRDGSYYVGTTRNQLEQRIADHNNGRFDGYISIRRPVTLVFAQSFQRITDAIAAERQIKGWSRAKKEALIARQYDRLVLLSRSTKDRLNSN